MELMWRSSAGSCAQASVRVAAPASAARMASGLALAVRGERARSESENAMGSASLGGAANSSGSKYPACRLRERL